MSQTRLPPTSHHFWLKSPCNLSSSVNSMTLLSSLTFSGLFNIFYIFLHLTNNDFWPPHQLDPSCCPLKGSLLHYSASPWLLLAFCLFKSRYCSPCFQSKVLYFRQIVSARTSWWNLYTNLWRKLSKWVIPSFLLLTHTQSWILLLTSLERTTEAVFIAVASTCFGSCS